MPARWLIRWSGLTMVSSLGLRGGALYFCAEGGEAPGTVFRFDLAKDETRALSLPNGSGEAVIADDTGIHVLDMRRGAETYTDDAAIEAGAAQGPALPVHASRLGVRPGGLLAAWHSTNELLLLEGGRESGTRPLTEFDGWVFGLAQREGDLLVVGGWSDDVRGIHVFDAASGRKKARLFAEVGTLGFQGLACTR